MKVITETGRVEYMSFSDTAYDNAVCFGTVPTVWYVLELFRQCGMLWYVFVLHSISMVQVSISVRRE
jgi:hypothetical protein